MKSFLLGGIAATTLNISAALAAGQMNVVSTQPDGTLRAPKLVGVAVYDRDNKDVGKIADLLVDHDGRVQTVVIGVGGFLGIGSKDIAVPYSAVQWKTDPRKVATNDASPAGATGGGGTSMTPIDKSMSPTDKTATKTIDPAKTEAYQGYPDRAMIDMSQAELKAAPEFKYASNPDEPADSMAPAVAPAKPANKS